MEWCFSTFFHWSGSITLATTAFNSSFFLSNLKTDVLPVRGKSFWSVWPWMTLTICVYSVWVVKSQRKLPFAQNPRHVVCSGPASLWTWRKLCLTLQLSCTEAPHFALGLCVPAAVQQERFSLCPVKPELLFSPAMSPGLFLIRQWRLLPKAIPQASRVAAEVGGACVHAWASGRAPLASAWRNGFTKRWEEQRAGQCGGRKAWKMILVKPDYIPRNMSLWSWDRMETIELFLSSPSFPANLSHSHVYYLWVLHGWSIFSSRKQMKAVFGKHRLCKVLLSQSSFFSN